MPRLLLSLCLIALLAPERSAQSLSEWDLIIADRGAIMNGSDAEIRRYNHVGVLKSTLPSVGNGPIRGIALDASNRIYMARGNQVWRYAGDPYVADAAPFASGTRIQDLAINPVTGHVWVSLGVNGGEAEIREYDPMGMLVQTVTDSLIEQPRSICFSEDGERLFVANVEGNNVLWVDLSGMTPVVAVHSSLGTFGSAGYSPISITRDPAFEEDDLYVSGDYISADDILRITGAPGSGTAASVINLSQSMTLNAAGGLWVDSWGNIYICSRARDMGTPGLFNFRLDGLPQPIAPYLGSEQINPIDVAFMKREISIEIVDGSTPSLFQINNHAGVEIGDSQPEFRVRVTAPDFPNRPFVVTFSLLTRGQCVLGNPQRPIGEGITYDPLDPRRTPLEADQLYLQSVQMLAASAMAGPMAPFPLNMGIVPFPLVQGLNCPASALGFARFQLGQTNSSGVGSMEITLPSFPTTCFPLPFDVRMGFAAAVLDGSTGPAGVGLLSPAPACLGLFNF